MVAGGVHRWLKCRVAAPAVSVIPAMKMTRYSLHLGLEQDDSGMLSAQLHAEKVATMKSSGIVMMGLLLPFGQAWGTGAAAKTGWQVTPFFGYSSAIDFEASDEVQPVPASTTLDKFQGERSGSWGLFISKEVDDPGMIELLYSHQSTTISPDQPDSLTVDTLHFAGALTLSDNLMAPYIGAGIGVTRFAAYDSEVVPSMSLALGVQPRLKRASGLAGRGAWLRFAGQ